MYFEQFTKTYKFSCLYIQSVLGKSFENYMKYLRKPRIYCQDKLAKATIMIASFLF